MLIMESRTSNGNSDEVAHFGGIVQIQVSGTFDGATATMQVSQDGLSFVSLTETNAIYTANDVVAFTMLKGAKYRLIVAGAGASTSLSASSLS